MERRLAAVMIADVAGYGHLSQTDEEGTRAHFQTELHEVFEPNIADHHGRLVKTMGDGLLVEFHSVVDALRCAVDVQRAEAQRNAALPTDRRMVFRIGINLGDVIVEGDDIHGDGVNIADRLQQLADPGGVVISGTAYDQVEKKLDVGYESLGERRVKNIDKPVRVYRVRMDADAAGKTFGVWQAVGRSWRLAGARCWSARPPGGCRGDGVVATVGTANRALCNRTQRSAAVGQAVDRGSAVRQPRLASPSKRISLRVSPTTSSRTCRKSPGCLSSPATLPPPIRVHPRMCGMWPSSWASDMCWRAASVVRASLFASMCS